MVAKSNRQNYTGIAHAAGLDSIISPKLITASQILQVVRGMQNSKGSVMNAMYKICDGHAEALEFIANETTHNRGSPLQTCASNMAFCRRYWCTRDSIVIPDGSASIAAGDTVIVRSPQPRDSGSNDIYEESLLELGGGA